MKVPPTEALPIKKSSDDVRDWLIIASIVIAASLLVWLPLVALAR
jgi:hypothetical protein